ncbi:L-arginine-binding protein-like [Glandiceps talaboti]
MAEPSGKYETQTDSSSVNFQMPSDRARMVNQDSSNESNRFVLALIAVIAIVAVVALVIAIIGFTRPPKMSVNVGNADGGMDSSSAEQSAGQRTDENSGVPAADDRDKTWIFAIGHDGTSLEYIDETGGLRGFHVDVVNEVCALANKDCRFMFDVYGRCWDSEAGHFPRIGVGLADRWYDACTGWFATYERLRTVDFTHAFRKSFAASFYVKKGNTGFDWTNLTGKKIGIADGWAADEYCLKRNKDKITGAELDSDQMIHYPSVESLQDALQNNEVDAVFANVNIFTPVLDVVDKVGQEITNCMKDGGAMMFRKDTRLSEWWNPAFERLKESSRYKQICDAANENHGHMPGDILCVD